MSKARASMEFVGIRRAQEITGWGTAKIMRRALLGEVSVDLPPGRPPMYSLDDLNRVIAAESKQRTGEAE